MANLIQASGVPCFGDDFGFGQDIVQFDLPQHRREFHRSATGATRQNRTFVEAEAVDMHVFDPEPQAFHDHLRPNRMVAVKGVSAACVVVVIVLVAIDQVVVVQVVKPAEREGRALMVAFIGVVEHNVQDHFDPSLVQRLHHVAELGHVLGFASRLAISGMRRKIRHGRIAPEVVQLVAFKLMRFGVVELEHGQQFNRRDA